MNKPYDAKDYWENRLKHNWGIAGVGYINLGVYYNQ